MKFLVNGATAAHVESYDIVEGHEVENTQRGFGGIKKITITKLPDTIILRCKSGPVPICKGNETFEFEDDSGLRMQVSPRNFKTDINGLEIIGLVIDCTSP